MDLTNIIQTSLDSVFSTGSTVANSKTIPRSTSETILSRSGDQQATFPTASTNMSGSTTIHLPSTSAFKDHSLILPPNLNTSDGPLLCQLDDDSYVLIEGLDQMTTTTSPTKTMETTSLNSTSPTKMKLIDNLPSIPGTIKASTCSSGVVQVKTTPIVMSTVTKRMTSPKTALVKSPTLITQSTTQGTTRPTFLVMSNTPITAKATSLTTKDSQFNFSKSFSIKPTFANSSTTSSLKPFTNIISTTAGQNSNAPLKYILIPQSKVSSKSPAPFRSSINSGMKITLNPMSRPSDFNLQTFNLPTGTTLIPTNTVANNKPMIIKPNATVIPPSKINFKVPLTHSAFSRKVQSPQTGITKASEMTTSLKSTEDGSNSNEPSKSPTLFDMTLDDINETFDSGSTKSLITYSKISPKVTVESLADDVTLRTSLDTPATDKITRDANKNVSSQPTVIIPLPKSTPLPLTYIVPNSSKKIPTPTIQPNRKRKFESKSILNTKKKKTGQKSVANSFKLVPSIGEAGVEGNMIREIIATGNIQSGDKAIISTAVHELKKLVARRELLLKQLNSSCLALGKVEYKLTISGSPINTQDIYQQISYFQQQFESDLKHLDWAVSAMHKLYSELAPKDETRTTEEILQDLIGPTEGIPDDPKAKYEKFKQIPSSRSPKKSIVRSPKKAKRTVLYKGEECFPPFVLKERKVPDKPDPSDGKFHCELCTKIFLKQISLAKHLEFDHPVSLELEKKLITPRSPKLPHTCKDCDKSFHSNIMLFIHRTNEHDASDWYEISRESKAISKRSASDSRILCDEDMKSPSEDESKPSKSTNRSTSETTRNAKSTRQDKKPKRRTRTTITLNKVKSTHIDSLDFLYDSKVTLSSSSKPNSRSSWLEVDLFDPDIPIECTDDNPIIPLKALSAEVIAAHTYSSSKN